MLDHYSGDNCGNEKELLDELFTSCEKMQPKLFRYLVAVLSKCLGNFLLSCGAKEITTNLVPCL